jgi:hypothetical protein
MSNISLSITKKQAEQSIKSLERLSNDNFDRPEITFQDTIQNNNDMEKYLKNYTKVKDIDRVALGTHLRYVTIDKDKKVAFRLGGRLMKKEHKYVVLSNGKQAWSVQKLHYLDDGKPPVETAFFKQTDKYDKLLEIIQKQQAKIDKLTQICTGICEHLNIDIEITKEDNSDIGSELTEASDYDSQSDYTDYSETTSVDY